MQDPDYGTISDVDPDGGAAPYTTLQGWFEDTYAEAEIQHARCHHGTSAGLGELDTSTQTWAYVPTADEPVCIYAAAGDEQDGSQDDPLQGAAITGESITCNLTWEHVRIDGIRMSAMGELASGSLITTGGCQSVIVDGCMMTFAATIIAIGEAIGIVGAAVTAATIRNCLFANKSAAVGKAIFIVAQPGSTVNASLYGNSVANLRNASGGIGALAIAPGISIVNVTARNNVVVEDGSRVGGCFAISGGGTVDWTGSSHNVSSDDTADTVVGGTDNIINAAIADVWADIADPDAPLTPKAGGDLDPPDGANLYAEDVTADAVGAERPSFGAQYRGGLEIFCGLYKAYGGATPALVDYATMLASVRAGSTGIDVTGLGLASGGTHYLGVRATSVAGVEETNTDRLTRAVVNQSGQLQPLPLAAVEELTAELQTDGTVIVGFAHKTWPGWAGPTRFEVLSDNGTGELNLTTPAATIDVTDPGAGDYEVALNPPTLPAMFSARACSGADDGPVAPPVTVSPPAGPTAPQQV